MKTKLRFLAISLLVPVFSLSAQEIRKFLGEYQVTATCVLEIDGTPFGGETVDVYNVIIEKSTEDDADIQFSVERFKVVAKATVLTDQEFDILQDQHAIGAGGMSYYLNGKGILETDSTLLMNYSILDKNGGNFVCDCKGKKIRSSGVSSLKANKYNVYVDAAKQQIILDEALQNQSLIIELVNLQGSIILKKTNTGEPVNIANLPRGVYLLRISQDGQVVYSEKILK